jgi:hypothetical protein
LTIAEHDHSGAGQRGESSCMSAANGNGWQHLLLATRF